MLCGRVGSMAAQAYGRAEKALSKWRALPTAGVGDPSASACAQEADVHETRQREERFWQPIAARTWGVPVRLWV